MILMLGQKGYEKFEIENILLHIWNQNIYSQRVCYIYKLDMKHPACRMYGGLHP